MADFEGVSGCMHQYRDRDVQPHFVNVKLLFNLEPQLDEVLFTNGCVSL